MVKHQLLLPLLLLLDLELLLATLGLYKKILELEVLSLVDGGSPGLVGLPDMLGGRPPLLGDDLGRLGQRDSPGDLLPHLGAEDGVAVGPASPLNNKMLGYRQGLIKADLHVR